MSQQPQQSIFSAGIDHRIVAISKATEKLNESFTEFLNKVARLDSLVSISFDRTNLQFKVESSLTLPIPVNTGDTPQHVGPEDVENKQEFTYLNDDTLLHIGVVSQDLDDAGKKVTTVGPHTQYVSGNTEGNNQHVSPVVQDDMITRFFISPEILDNIWHDVEDNMIFNQDIASYSNYIVKADKKKEGKHSKSINLLDNFHTILETWYDQSAKMEGMTMEAKTNFAKTIEGIRLLYLARSTDNVHPCDRDTFLAHGNPTPTGDGFNLGWLVNLSKRETLTPKTWKILKPLFAQYLNKQTGGATEFASSLRSFWKPSEMERLKLEAVSCFETKPQGKGHLGKSKQKKSSSKTSEKGKQKAKDESKGNQPKKQSQSKKRKSTKSSKRN